MPKASSGKTSPAPQKTTARGRPAAPKAALAAPRGRAAAPAGSRRQAPAARTSGEEPFARIVVDVPESTHRQLKATAAMEGKSIRDYILEMLGENGIL